MSASRTYTPLHRGDLGAGDLAQLRELVEHLQGGDEEHDVGQREKADHLAVRVLVHILADQHAVVLGLAQVPQDFHSWRGEENTAM